MGHVTSTHTHTYMKPVPALMGIGTNRYGYGYLWVRWVWNPCGSTVWVATQYLVSSQSVYTQWGQKVFTDPPLAMLVLVSIYSWSTFTY